MTKYYWYYITWEVYRYGNVTDIKYEESQLATWQDDETFMDVFARLYANVFESPASAPEVFESFFNIFEDFENYTVLGYYREGAEWVTISLTVEKEGSYEYTAK